MSLKDILAGVRATISTGIIPKESFNNNKRRVFSTLGHGRPAYSYAYDLTIRTSGFAKPLDLVGATNFNFPTAAVNFRNAPEFGYNVIAALEDMVNKEIVYWDTVDWIFTRELEARYNSQFADGLLKENYASTEIDLVFGPLVRKYIGCALNRPAPESGNSVNNLLNFRFSFAYHSVEDKFNFDFINQ